MNMQEQVTRFLRLPEVSYLTGLGKSTILAWESQNRFPRAVRLSPTIRVWMAGDIEDWIRESYARNRKDPNDIRLQNGSNP
jgi:predicted DNA-binding transcriptional regulator AlpA